MSNEILLESNGIQVRYTEAGLTAIKQDDIEILLNKEQVSVVDLMLTQLFIERGLDNEDYSQYEDDLAAIEGLGFNYSKPITQDLMDNEY